MLVPCQACGAACGSSCKAVEFCCCPANRPSPIFVFFAVLMNGLVILFAIMGLVADNEVGNVKVDDPNIWLIIMLIVALINILFSFYIYCRFHTMTSQLPGPDGTNPQAKMSPWGAAWKLMMYDVGVCFFILVAIFTWVWLIVKSKYECNFPATACTDKEDAMDNIAICMWVFTLLGGVVIALSLCTQCCKKPKHQVVIVQQAVCLLELPFCCGRRFGLKKY